jgi:hypothetical protein
VLTLPLGVKVIINFERNKMIARREKPNAGMFLRLSAVFAIMLCSAFAPNTSKASNEAGYEGHYTTHYPNGQLRYSINYVKGKREGVELTYFESGKIKEKQFYKNNKEEGEAFTFYENGNPHIKSIYVNGKLEGEQITYHENGSVAISEHYRNGVKDGLRKAYNEQGILEANQRFINGNFDPIYVGMEKTPSCSLTPDQVKKKLKWLCTLISERDEDPSPKGRYQWLYQRQLMDASCVDVATDSEELIAQKISKMWKENEETLICNNTRFDISNGNLIKYAVASKFDEFLISAASWNLNFNKVDKSDGRTVLDYIHDHIDRHKGHPIERKLKQYYRMLREAGAKHRSEL